MALLKRDHMDLLLGIGVLALGLGLLVFTFSHALALAGSPGDFLRSQMPQNQTPKGPSASFRWDSNGFNVTVADTSQQGDVAITSWQWDFGDGSRPSGQSPGVHTYANPGLYQASLIVRDGNGKESRAFAQVDVVPMQTRSGESAADPTAGLSLNFDLSGILQPVAIVLLTGAMYIVLAIVGGTVTKAGWNLIKPKPETVRVRMKPRQLTQAFEEDAARAAMPPPPTA
jgi:PKD domain